MEQFAAWVEAIGTIIAAIAETPSFRWSLSQMENLMLWGNVLQATGNGLLADLNPPGSKNQIGNIIQSSGNSTIVASLLFDVTKSQEQLLTVQGNQLQALGASLSLVEGLEQGDIISIYSNALQAKGNILQAEGAKRNRKDWSLAGSWIQATGATLAAIYVTPNE
ncbi:DUF6944 family repetitive protein [Halobacillus salinus]|uniref:Uncharacterized protein n=1 Tax=Halobacillus salinus TaxID=192814 RepID=A0A4Z0H3D1_9BACI|nr:hypothetical protein [Halobacillus salinus]TGB04439.1 hypothetical protein E4663_05435 [Halobacillus salinus]